MTKRGIYRSYPLGSKLRETASYSRGGGERERVDERASRSTALDLHLRLLLLPSRIAELPRFPQAFLLARC